MSSYESANSADAEIDIWRVQLQTGEIRTMTLDALDEAFQAGTIDERTSVLAPGTTSWAKLADAAGLDSPSLEVPANSVGPMELQTDAQRSSLSDLDSLEPDAFKPKKGRVYVGIALAVMVVGGLGFAATHLAPVTSSAANALSAEEARKSAATAPPTAVEDENAAARLKILTEEQRVKLLEADKARQAREAAKKKDRPAPPTVHRSGPQPKSRTPFVNGGNKYDPLNGAL